VPVAPFSLLRGGFGEMSRSRIFPVNRETVGALRMDARKTAPYGRRTQSIPVGETIRKDGAEGATGPGNSQANGPQEDGSLESGGASFGSGPPTK
jgi:hypothetical protein